MADANTQTITVSTGTITFNSTVSSTSTHNVISVTSTGTINFNGGFTDGNTVLSEVSGSTITFGGNYTVQTAAVTWTAGANAIFTVAGDLVWMNDHTDGSHNLSECADQFGRHGDARRQRHR
jgi:hypothetical protein